jgi:hypothetical protein
MKSHPYLKILALLTLLLATGSIQATDRPDQPGRSPAQPVDDDYTKKILEYTTKPYFKSPLVDYLPASPTVPTPKAVLGDIAGAPGKLPYSAEVYRYMRMLEKATPRVKVYSIGTTEEGREMIAVAVGSDENIAKLEENRARLVKLADPRTINMDDSTADTLVAESAPIYYITGTIHSPETGAPTALMELAYRLAVDESPYIKTIRDNVITLITPIVEVDGRDRMADLYNWHLAHPGENYPPLLYWGKYVAHDNNRDAMGLTLKLSENILNTYIHWKAQVLHDLHESVPYLYDNTIGDEPYNAWLDPILTDEWQLLGWKNVSEMTKFGMPGVFTHGTFDTWSPGYLMFMAATHNGISRLYETFGNGGADTVERELQSGEYERTWYRQNPPLPKTLWSQRNNNNYEQTGLLVSLHFFAENSKMFLHNFYLKSKRSILKPQNEGPAAYVFPADDPRLVDQAGLLRLLQRQGCEISRAKEAFTVDIPVRRPPRGPEEGGPAAAAGGGDGQQPRRPQPKTEAHTFPAGSYIVRMDQPYSRIADMLLDYQYWSPNDPQRSPYDDTGWTFGELYNVKVVRVTQPKVLETPVERVQGEVKANSGVNGPGTVFLVNNAAEPALIQLRYRLKSAEISVAEDPFEVGGHKYNRGSFIVHKADAAEVSRVATDLGIQATAADSAPSVKSHPARAARIAILHSWQATQTEGWWRMALDKLGIPYEYISTQKVAKDADLNSKYDVILFPPVGRGGPQQIIAGLPMWGNPLPWKKTSLTPNMGTDDSTDDIRPGLGWAGLENLQRFTQKGGLLITVMDTSDLAVEYGLTQGVSIVRPQRLKLVGSVVKSRLVDGASPIAYGYDDGLSIYSFQGPIFNVSNSVGGRGGRRFQPEGEERMTGRGTRGDPDTPQGRPMADIPEEPRSEAWQATPLTDEQRRNNVGLIPPAYRPRVVFRYADNRELLVSGLVDGGTEIAQHAAVIDVPVAKGHVILFSNNPIWRGETIGSYSMVFNAIMNFDSLNAGRKLDEK